MENETHLPPKEDISEVIKRYKESGNIPHHVSGAEIPSANFNKEEFEKTMAQETDPDLLTTYEIIKLPSKGLFYKNGLAEVNVEYMTSEDEDILTTPSLIDSGDVLNMVLKRKIKTPNVNVDDLLEGDRNAIILFLRISSYGNEYKVNVTDPRNGNTFHATVDLYKLNYKEIEEKPDENGHFTVELPMRKKTVVFRLLTYGEDNKILNTAEKLKETYNTKYSKYNTLKLKAHIVSINGKTDRDYISKFVDAMPAGDSAYLKRKIVECSPDVDMMYEFTAKDGFKFKALLTIGIDFFFPNI